MLVVHRVLRHLSDGSYLTKGDGRATFDSEPVAPGEAIGRVVAFDRGGGLVSAEGRGPRFYAGILSFHSEVIGLLSATASLGDRAARRLFRRADTPLWMRRVVALADRLVLRAADMLLFRLFHRRWWPPPTPDEPASS
jgi:hypothetical protein